MGGFNPISAVMAPHNKELNFIQNVARTKQAQQQARETYNLNEHSIAQQAKLERDQLELEAENTARTRQNALRRTMAKQKALYGAQGIDTSDGSGEAVMLGLLSENDEEKQYRDKLDTIRRQTLAQNTKTKRQRNLLNLRQHYQNTTTGLAHSFIDTVF